MNNSTLEGTSLGEQILETKIAGGVQVWHVLSIICCVALVILIFLCCCINFRIPRTKQEIEADYVRKKITKKFRKQLNLIPDSEMDEIDLTKAIERVRFELLSEEEKEAELRAKENPYGLRDDFNGDMKCETLDKTSVSSDPLNTGNSEEKLMEDKNSNQFNTKFVTIVNAFNVLKSKKSSKQITV